MFYKPRQQYHFSDLSTLVVYTNLMLCWAFTFMLLLQVTSAAKLSRCSRKIYPPHGTFSYPLSPDDMKACTQSHIWEIRVHKKFSLRFRFSNIFLLGSQIVISKKRWARKSYKKQEVINLSGSSSTVVVKAPYKFVQIMMNGSIGQFKAEYEVFFCPLPGIKLSEGVCSNGYRKYSWCNFTCAQGYYPKDRSAISFQATCRGISKWSRNINSKCLSFNEFEKICSIQDEACPFNDTELLQMFPPDVIQFEIPPLIFPPLIVEAPFIPHFSIGPPQLGAFQIEGRALSVGAPQPALRPLTWKDKCKIYKMCKKDDKGNYVQKCADFSYQLTCMICRLILRICARLQAFS